MKITSITGKLKSDELSVTKSIGGLILGLSFPIDELLNEKISIYIERGNGNNVIMANKVLLRDFILASSYGSEAIQADATYPSIAICELAVDGGIFLAEKEMIKISFDDLRSLQTYDIYGVEEPTATNNLYFFEQKTIASEEYNKKIDVRGFDLAVMTVDQTVSDVSYTYEHENVISVVKYLPFELQTLSRDIDPIQAIKADGTVMQSLTGRLTLPLVEVEAIEVNKSQGAIINFVMRTIKNVQ